MEADHTAIEQDHVTHDKSSLLIKDYIAECW